MQWEEILSDFEKRDQISRPWRNKGFSRKEIDLQVVLELGFVVSVGFLIPIIRIYVCNKID